MEHRSPVKSMRKSASVGSLKGSAGGGLASSPSLRALGRLPKMPGGPGGMSKAEGRSSTFPPTLISTIREELQPEQLPPRRRAHSLQPMTLPPISEDGAVAHGAEAEAEEVAEEEEELAREMAEEESRHMDEVEAQIEAELQRALAELAGHMRDANGADGKQDGFAGLSDDLRNRMANIPQRIKTQQARGRDVRRRRRA
mmetsp:Transcript_60407/g.155698  ORF Transcript_60407/g.155698 Transcript_60407/m.155698 type:complete len:199 (+) Transcript_60407:67-663(+)